MSDREDAGRAVFERVLVSGSSVLMNALVLRNAARIDAAKRLFTDTPALKTPSQRAAPRGPKCVKEIHVHRFQ